MLQGKNKSASAGNRTRIYCLEGNNANLYTTDAVQLQVDLIHLILSSGTKLGVYCKHFRVYTIIPIAPYPLLTTRSSS